MKKYAVIDIGTNSIRLLLATIEGNKTEENHGDYTPDHSFPTKKPVSYNFIERKKYINTTRIGASINKNKIISREGIEKNVNAFCNFVQKAEEYGAEKILAIATSAVRDAKNGEEFIYAIHQKTGVNVKIIDGQEEAELGYRGVLMGMGHSGDGPFVSLGSMTQEEPSPCVPQSQRGISKRKSWGLVPWSVFFDRGPCPRGFQCHSETDRISLTHEESRLNCHSEMDRISSTPEESRYYFEPRLPIMENRPFQCRGDFQSPTAENSFSAGIPNILVIDIGGGSTELILGTEHGDIIKTLSLDIGAVRMTKKFITTDPIDKKEYEKMKTTIYETIKEAKQKRHSGDGPFVSLGSMTQKDRPHCVPPSKCHPGTGEINSTSEEFRFECHSETDKTNGAPEESQCHSKPLAENSFPAPPTSLTTIGIGGTITTLAALHQKLDPYDPEKVHNYKLTLKDINNLKEKLLSLTIQQIKQLKGIHPKRADIITAGITILSITMDSLNLKEIIISEYDNLEGMLYTLLPQ
ncbi:MAG TPA: hypothetical protein VFD17_03060 [Clostridia bacterium]|nr:hypothetical protein [Clostridia bacterium]